MESNGDQEEEEEEEEMVGDEEEPVRVSQYNYHISNPCHQALVRLNSLDNRHLIKQIGPIVINSVPPSKPTRHIVRSQSSVVALIILAVFRT